MPEVQSVSAAQQQVQSQQESYVVQHGDTLSGIASRHGVSLAELEAANPQIHNPNLIYPGQHVTIPGQGGGAGSQPSAPVENGAGNGQSPSGLSMSDKGIRMLEGFEGLRLDAYQDSGGVWTIGYGHTGGVHAGDHITQQQAEQYLRQDIGWAQDAVRKNVHVPLNQNQFDALTSLTYNLGANGYPTLLDHLNSGNYAAAQRDFSMYVHDSKGHVLQGLVNRRNEEAALFGSSAPGGTSTPSTPSQPSTPSHSAGDYTVRSGDTLSGIAAQHGVSLSALEAANPEIRNPNLIHPGQTVHIPGGSGSNAATSHDVSVQRGDTLSGIAERNGVSLAALIRANPQISNPNLIYPGQTVHVPGSGSTSGPSSTAPVEGPGSTSPASGNKVVDIAKSFLGRNASELKRSGALPMNPNVPSDVCCANFVSAVLQKAGVINFHTDLVSGSNSGDPNAIGTMLKARGWHVVDAAHAKPGDVCILNNGGHVELVAGNSNGNITLIGSNNINADGTQQISYGHPYGGAWYLSPP
ncbi:MAG TPA: LysM peptidoglycan-binding domain-containing protein [Rhodanobacteraceae bacterium]|nr:LysM peptidoglycan-binding domain-containing protein [Rhodanobacteraceae bacterium]